MVEVRAFGVWLVDLSCRGTMIEEEEVNNRFDRKRAS